MTAPRRIRRVGDSGLLVECADLDAVMALHGGLAVSRRPKGVLDIVPAARSLLVTVSAPADLARVRQWLDATGPVPFSDASGGEEITIDVRYDGKDLADVARHTGLSEREVVDRHTGSTWRVAFGGFAPGFGYLVTDAERLHVPRRASPRTNVPAGSVALAGEFTGVYPRSSPGGWQLIGRTDAELWNAGAEHPALLEPGTLVRFREVP